MNEPDGGTSPSYIVGIGASSGGLDSLERVFGAFPPDSGMALVVVQHLPPERRGAMADLISRHTEMPVVVATDQRTVVANTVYLVPPSHNLELSDGKLVLTPRMDRSLDVPNFAIDQFFVSLAIDAAERAVGVVLSGTGSDGAHGAAAIRSAGGVVLAEDPTTAKFADMPQAAIDTGAVSRVCQANALAGELLRHVGMLEQGQDVPLHGLERIVTAVSRHIGVDFHAYKRGTVGRRVERRRNATDCPSLDAYAERLEASPEECDALGQDLLVGVTTFFRDPEVYAALQPLLVDTALRVSTQGDPSLRVWVPACSTGEEAYSIAIACHEAIRTAKVSVELKVFATDVNTEALAIAGRGRYPLSIRASVSDERLRRFFSAEPDAYVARPFLRESVVFARHDILRDPPFTRLDLLSCRNLLIYLDASAQRRTAQVFRFGLRPGGLLLLGQSETVSGSKAFDAVNERARIYAMEKPGRAGRPLGTAVPSLTRRVEISPSAPVSTPRRSVDPGAWLLERTLEQLGTPVLVLNHAGDLAYAFGEIARTLRVPAGRTGWRATDLLPPQAAAVVSSAIAQASERREPVVVEDFAMQGDDGQFRGTMRAVPLEHRDNQTSGVALLFDAPWEPSEGTSISVDDAVRHRIRQLEAELARVQLELAHSREKLDTSTEELQATNEELVSSNEELQSTNEELQSLNEELHTVNAELQFKVEELSELSSDLENLLRSVQGGLLFLDHGGRIRRYNDAVLDVLPLVPHDEGRSIGDIAHGLVDVDLGHEVRRVVQTQLGYEREVRTREGKSYSLSLQPFAQGDSGSDGVVLTLNDVSGLSEANERLRGCLQFIGQWPAPTVIVSRTTGIEFVNAAFAELTGLTVDDVAGQPLSAVFHPRTEQAVLAALGGPLGCPWTGSATLRTGAPEGVPADVAAYPMQGADGSVGQVALTFQPT